MRTKDAEWLASMEPYEVDCCGCRKVISRVVDVKLIEDKLNEIEQEFAELQNKNKSLRQTIHNLHKISDLKYDLGFAEGLMSQRP